MHVHTIIIIKACFSFRVLGSGHKSESWGNNSRWKGNNIRRVCMMLPKYLIKTDSGSQFQWAVVDLGREAMGRQPSSWQREPVTEALHVSVHQEAESRTISRGLSKTLKSLPSCGIVGKDCHTHLYCGTFV